MAEEKALNDDSTSPGSEEFDAEVTDITGHKRTIRLQKDAKFNDFYSAWTGKRNQETVSAADSLRMLKEKGVYLWRVHKTEGEYMIRKLDAIYTYVKEGCQLFLLENGYKLIVIFFDDDDVVSVPVQPTITTAEVSRVPLVMEKLIEKGLRSSYVLVKRYMDSGLEIPLKDDYKPMEMFYSFESGVARRKTEVKAKLMFKKRTEIDFGEDEEKEEPVSPISMIPENAPDLFPVYRPPSQREKSPIKRFFESLMEGKNTDKDNGECHDNFLRTSVVDVPQGSKIPGHDVIGGVDTEVIRQRAHNVKQHVESPTKEQLGACTDFFGEPSIEPEIGTVRLIKCDSDAAKSGIRGSSYDSRCSNESSTMVVEGKCRTVNSKVFDKVHGSDTIITDEEEATPSMEEKQSKSEMIGRISNVLSPNSEKVDAVINDGDTERQSEAQGYNVDEEDGKIGKTAVECPWSISGMLSTRTELVSVTVNDENGDKERNSKTEGYNEHAELDDVIRNECTNEDEPISKSPTEMSLEEKADSMQVENKLAKGDSSAEVITIDTIANEKEEVDSERFPETNIVSSPGSNSEVSNVHSETRSGMSSANALAGNGPKNSFDSELARQIDEQGLRYNSECSAIHVNKAADGQRSSILTEATRVSGLIPENKTKLSISKPELQTTDLNYPNNKSGSEKISGINVEVKAYRQDRKSSKKSGGTYSESSVNTHHGRLGCPPPPIVGENVGMILPPMDQENPTIGVPPLEKSRKGVGTTLPITKVNGGFGTILPLQNTPSSGPASSSVDEGISTGNSYDGDDYGDDDDDQGDYDSDGSSSPSNIEDFMESISVSSSKTDENAIACDSPMDTKDINVNHCSDYNRRYPANERDPVDKEQPTSLQEEPYVIQQGPGEQKNLALPPPDNTQVNTNEMALDREKQPNGSLEAAAIESIYDKDEPDHQGKRSRKNAFKGNQYEKEVRMERIRRNRSEKRKSMEKEANKKHEEEARLKEVKLKESLQRDTIQKETSPQEKRPIDTQQQETTQVKDFHQIVPPLNMVREADAVIGARSASPMERRMPCATCEHHNVAPFQVVKYRKMKEVLDKCTRYNDVRGDTKYDYLCLSGVHIRNVNGSWQLTDDTVFHSESELTDSLDSIDSQAIDAHKDTIASKVNREKQVNLNGGVCCHWIPLANGGKWRVTGFIEEKLKPLNFENDNLRPSSSPYFGASANEENVNNYNTLPSNKGQPVATRFNSMKDTLSKKMESTVKGVGSIVKSAFPPQRPSQEVYVPLEMLQFRDSYVVPLGRIVGTIGQQFLNAETHRDSRQVGDDSVNSDIGWLVRRDFCTAFFTLVLHRVKKDTTAARFIMGRKNKFSLWSLIKDVSQACVEEGVLREIVRVIEKSPFLFDDDLRARNFVCETLNWSNETCTEKLLVTWLRYFTKLKHILNKYFEQGSVWRRPDRENASVVMETLHILGELNEFHFNLHADFEHKELAKRMREQDLVFILQREPKNVDIDVMALE